jgi:potassium-transporting ATPase KdpC subunit
MLFWMTLITGAIYPLLVTMTVQLIMPEKANGSIIYVHGKAVGSKLIGQKFASDKYFWGRPSAHDYDPLYSGGSNLGPISLELKKLVAERKSHLLKANGGESVPDELLFASGSGLDPHIYIKTALFQKSRIVKARGGDGDFDAKLSEMIMSKAKKRTFGFIGMPCVNVLELNLALDEIQEKHE